MRAGLTCSNPSCRVYTGGPDDNIGVAAHISAAAPGGPRYDASLSARERRSSSNGIWLCQTCAKLIDSKEFERRFPIGLLRLWKNIAERQARAYVGTRSPFIADLAPVTSVHARLIELSVTKNENELYEIISGQSYVYSTTSEARDEIAAHRTPETVLDWTAEILVDCWGDGEAELLGICGVLLSSFELWNPPTSVLDEVENLCVREIKERDHMLIGVVEPLAFALAAKGRPVPHRAFLTAIVAEEHWREAEHARSRRYYGSDSRKALAVSRHMRDPLRAGLLRANDVGRLMGLLTRPTPDLARPRARALLRGLLRESVLELQRAGEFDLVKEATSYLAGYDINLEKGEPDE